MRRFPTKLLVLTLSAVACQQRTSQQGEATVSSSQRAAITDSVRKATSDFFAAAEHVDKAKAAPFFSHGRDFTFASDGSAWIGWESFQGLFDEGWKDVRSQQISVHNSSLAVLSPSVVVETISASGNVVDTAGKKRIIDKSAMTLLWVRDSTGWKILSLHQSFAPPATK